MNELKKVRKELSINQKQASNACGVSLRTYQSYEETDQKSDKYNDLLDKLREMGVFDSVNYIISPKLIKNTCRELFRSKYHEIVGAYLYGSYATGHATGQSNVNIMVIVQKPLGKRIKSLNKELSNELHKDVVVETFDDLMKNPKVIKNIFLESIKIY